jgi:uncharacterized protein (DUF302 family)
MQARVKELTRNGIVQLQGKHNFEDTLQRLESALSSRELTIFARIDFSGDAERASLKMRPTRLVVFGDPKAGTPLMIATPTVAIDLPLKILVSEDENRTVWVSYNSPQYLKDRHSIPDTLLPNLAGIATIAHSAAE